MIRFLYLILCVVVMSLSTSAKIVEIPKEDGGVKWTLIYDGKKAGFKTDNFTLEPQKGYEDVDLNKTPIGNLFICKQKNSFHIYDWNGKYLCNVQTQKAFKLVGYNYQLYYSTYWTKSERNLGYKKWFYLLSRSKNGNFKGVVEVIYNSLDNTCSAREIIPTEYRSLSEYNGWWCCWNDPKGKLISRDGGKTLPRDGWFKRFECETLLGCFLVGNTLYDKDGGYIKGYVRRAYVVEEKDFNYIEVELEDGRQGIFDGNGKQIVDFVNCSGIAYEGHGEFRPFTVEDDNKRNPSKTMHYDPWGWYGTAMYNNMWSTPYIWSEDTYSYPTTPSSPTSSDDLNNRRRDNLNRVAGEACLSCKGSGKCPTCNGTKVASSFGNTYKCTVCDDKGNCPTCDGTGKTSWIR